MANGPKKPSKRLLVVQQALGCPRKLRRKRGGASLTNERLLESACDCIARRHG
jgi:hypothetical protein